MKQIVQLQRIIVESAADAKRRRKEPSVSSPEAAQGAASALSPADALVTAAADAPLDPDVEEEAMPITGLLASLQSVPAPEVPAGLPPLGSSSSGSSCAGPSALACIPPMSYSGNTLLPLAPTTVPGMPLGFAPIEQFLGWLAMAPPAWATFGNGLSGYYDGMDLTALGPAPLTLWESRFGARIFQPIASFAFVRTLCLGKNPNNVLPVSVSHSFESCALS